jgi:hypothetical protein
LVALATVAERRRAVNRSIERKHNIIISEQGIEKIDSLIQEVFTRLLFGGSDA